MYFHGVGCEVSDFLRVSSASIESRSGGSAENPEENQADVAFFEVGSIRQQGLLVWGAVPCSSGALCLDIRSAKS